MDLAFMLDGLRHALTAVNYSSVLKQGGMDD
jgi:hypothetical protein